MLKFDKINTTTLLLYGAVAALVIYTFRNGVKSAVKNVTTGAINTAGDVVSGVAVGVGTSLGVPETNLQMCDIAKRNGDTLGASKYCTAGDFITWKASGMPSALDVIKYTNPITSPIAIGTAIADKLKSYFNIK
jgi:hypothetical protein